ncbi:MAG: integrase core domain-containing protein [archaeon]|nr:integrase core domain-containing protein [Bacilli bacterium]MCQ2976446.1 integrase core domain-containing protein [archaeon]
MIRPRTPEHNGKVERNHGIDQDKFYRYLKFCNLNDLREQGERWNNRYNNMPKLVLKFKTPNKVELKKLAQLLEDTGEMRCRKCLTSFES